MPNKTPTPPSRENKRALTVWLDLPLITKVNMASVMEDRTIQDIVRDALTQYLEREHKP